MAAEGRHQRQVIGKTSETGNDDREQTQETGNREDIRDR